MFQLQRPGSRSYRLGIIEEKARYHLRPLREAIRPLVQGENTESNY